MVARLARGGSRDRQKGQSVEWPIRWRILISPERRRRQVRNPCAQPQSAVERSGSGRRGVGRMVQAAIGTETTDRLPSRQPVNGNRRVQPTVGLGSPPIVTTATARIARAE